VVFAFHCLVFRCDTLRARACEFRNENQHDLEFPRTPTGGFGMGQIIPSNRVLLEAKPHVEVGGASIFDPTQQFNRF
jgi:hypothetical protein